jgi:8-oxo-dGTP pyrophosphatase MutT (NUDIX family)
MLVQNFDEALEYVLCEEYDADFTAAVGIVQDGDRWLLGLARNTGDDRTGKWVFPGGHIKRGEDPTKAAEREVREETGIRCKAVGEPITDPRKKGVAFVHCKVTSAKQNPDPNHEFSAIGLFTKQEMKSLTLYNNVERLIKRVR